MRVVLIDNAVGLWWGKTFLFVPIHIGFVVSKRTDLKNTVVVDQGKKVSETPLLSRLLFFQIGSSLFYCLVLLDITRRLVS